jgi:hypothetical protein
MTEIEKCYGTDGIPVQQTYINELGQQRMITEASAYNAARFRCTNTSNKDYFKYGGRGIEFRFTSFDEWAKELGPKPSHLYSVDRIDNYGHYEIGNVRWATVQQQAINRRTTKSIELVSPSGCVNEFESASAAAIAVNQEVTLHHILNLCHGKFEETKGYRASFIN